MIVLVIDHIKLENIHLISKEFSRNKSGAYAPVDDQDVIRPLHNKGGNSGLMQTFSNSV